MVYDNLGIVLTDIANNLLIEGDILSNLDTGERAIVKDRGLYFLTFNNYISNEVPIVSGMVDAQWELEQQSIEAISLSEAIHLLARRVPVTTLSDDRGYYTLRTVDEFLDAVKADIDVLDNDFFTTGEKPKEEPERDDVTKYHKRTSETEAWGMLMDRYLFHKPVKEIATKYAVSVRNVYYILDGTYYPKVYQRFSRMLEEGELQFDSN